MSNIIKANTETQTFLIEDKETKQFTVFLDQIDRFGMGLNETVFESKQDAEIFYTCVTSIRESIIRGDSQPTNNGNQS